MAKIVNTSPGMVPIRRRASTRKLAWLRRALVVLPHLVFGTSFHLSLTMFWKPNEPAQTNRYVLVPELVQSTGITTFYATNEQQFEGSPAREGNQRVVVINVPGISQNPEVPSLDS